MAEINKEDIKLFSSQRLDDTTQGGGAMTFTEIVDGAVNNLFPDISRLDRVYGRVSMRKAFMAVDTPLRPTYYGAHAVITKQADDPLVGVSFFTTEDWFDTRLSAQSRVESYLAKGPTFGMALYGNHYSGSRALRCITGVNGNAPEIGEVLVLVTSKNLSGTSITQVIEYVRIRDVSYANQEFFSGSTSYQMKIIDITLGNALAHDFKGVEASQTIYFTTVDTVVYETVVADSALYYGISALAEDVTSGSLSFRVVDINVPLVPSAQSQTPILDSGAGNLLTPLIQVADGTIPVITKTISYNTTSLSTTYLGLAILPGTFNINSGAIVDNSKGTLTHSSLGSVGSILYDTGIITWTYNWCPSATNYSTTFTAAAAPNRVSKSGQIYVDTNNRGFVYVFDCEPIPAVGSLKVDFLVSGKWYSLWDRGSGELRGSDNSIGVGTISYVTGSVSLTLGSMPDAGSDILLFWSENVTYKSIAGYTEAFRYEFNLEHLGIAPNSFSISWTQDGSKEIHDGGDGFLYYGDSDILVGVIDYILGGVQIHNLPITPAATTSFTIAYNYGEPEEEVFTDPPRDPDSGITLSLNNTSAILPNTLSIVWHTFVQIIERTAPEKMITAPPRPQATSPAVTVVDTPVTATLPDVPVPEPPDTVVRRAYTCSPEAIAFNNRVMAQAASGGSSTIVLMDPTHIYNDDGDGGFKGEDPTHGGASGSFAGEVTYTSGAGEVRFFPDFMTKYPEVSYGFRDVGDVYPAESGATFIAQERYVTGTSYVSTADLFPVDGDVTVTYYTAAGSTSHSYETTLNKTYSFDPWFICTMVPNSGVFQIDTTVIVDRQGKLYADIDTETGAGTQIGTIDYSAKELTITTDHSSFVNDSGNAFLYCVSGMTSDVKDSLTSVVFRTPGSPITPSSFTVEAVASDGTQLSATGDFDGNVVGTGIKGTIRYITGIVNLAFGTMVTDDASAQAEDWYHADNVSAGQVWKPYFVDASTITMNCVVESYLPLDADLLGLDPVRLPLDGRVPIFRDGDILLIHNTETIAAPNPLSAGQEIEIGRTNLSLVELYDSSTDQLYVPDTKYTVNLETGILTMATPLDLTGFTQPLTIMHRIEDMVLASDVQITGHIAVISQLTHDYAADVSFVSSVLPIGDLQSRAYNEFEQTSWTSVWSDTLIGTQPIASFDLINYPITVANESSTQERFACIFQSTTLVQVVGEHLGVLKNGSDTTWNITTTNIAPLNPITGNPYFIITKEGWGAGWVTGNVFRFNTSAGNYPLWFVRTTLQGPATESSDDYSCQVRGDSS
jgi:hypothetical protein